MATPTEFMHRVVPWPQAGETGWINVHYQFVPQGNTSTDSKGLPWAGRPFQSLAEFMGYVNWCHSKPQSIKNIFFCLSRQAKINGYNNGKPKAARDARDAMFLKAIWLDVDVKTPPKGYSDVNEAGRAVLTFCKSAGIPGPTALVKSGGGLHAYWISDRPLTPDEWRPYAEGLKARAISHGLRFDAGVTSDAARILRVPGTLNFKENIPREVDVIYLNEQDYDFAQVLGHITVNTPVTAAVTTKPPPTLDLSKIVLLPSIKAMFDATDSLSNGIESSKDVLLNWGLVEDGCPFFKEAKATGGRDHDQSLWNLAVLATTFFENGEPLAHELSNGYPTYTVEETDKMYARKAKERVEKDLGWPSCKSISGNGCKLCAGCPHFGKIKSPLELGRVAAAVPGPQPSLAATPQSRALNLPNPGPYFVDDEGFICELVVEKGARGQGSVERPVRLIESLIKDPWMQAEGHALNFIAKTDVVTWGAVKVTAEERATQNALMNALARGGVGWNVQYETRLRSFFMAWIKQLTALKASCTNRPFGWVFTNGKRSGFSYGEKTIFTDGSEVPSSIPDVNIRAMYAPEGSAQPWYDALKLILDQKRPHLEVLVAAAFATPIMWATGGTGGTFAAWSDSGSNKSSALIVALAVWGDPLLTKLKPDSTERFIEDKLGTIDCLPLVIDDAQKSTDFSRVCDVLFDVTSGVNRGRMKQNVTSMAQKKSKSSLLATANASFYDYMIQVKKVIHDADLARMMEMHVPMPDVSTPGRISQSEADKVFGELEHNRGVVGLEYVRWLVANLPYVEKYCDDLAKKIESEVSMRPLERFWKSFTAAVLAGAHFAEKALGIQFDIPGVHKALIEAYMHCRARIEFAQVAGNTQSAVEQVISAFITRYYDHQIYTNTVPSGTGVPMGITFLGGGPKRTPVHIQWCVEDRLLRFNKSVFLDYLIEKKHSTSNVMEGLQKHFHARSSKKVRLAGGTAFAGPPVYVIEMPIQSYHFLEATLYKESQRELVPGHVQMFDPITAPVTTAADADTSDDDAAPQQLAA